MPAYNAEKYIEESITSVLNQTFSDFELLIVDDASKDATLSIIKKFKRDTRVVLFENRNNLGISKSRNIAIEAASGRYIAFLDSDDIWYENKLERQISYFKKYGCIACATNYMMIRGDGTFIKEVKSDKLLLRSDDMLKFNYVGNLTGMYDTKLTGKVYQKDIKHEDYLMWLNISDVGPIHVIDECLAKYRVHDFSRTSNKFKSLLWHYSLLRQGYKLSSIKATHLTFLSLTKKLKRYL